MTDDADRATADALVNGEQGDKRIQTYQELSWSFGRLIFQFKLLNLDETTELLFKFFVT